MLTLPDYPLRQRDFLLEISRAITSRLELSEVLRRVLHASVAMTAGRVGIIALRDDETDMFKVRAYTGIASDMIPGVNDSLREIIMSASTERSEYEHLNKMLSAMAAAIDKDLRQSVAMPLVFDKLPLGLLIVFRSYQVEVTQNDLQMLHSFADQAAIAVHNAQLYERIEHEHQRLSAILQNSGDGVMILSADLTILQINRAFESMTGWSAAEAVGLAQDDLIIWHKIDQDDLHDAIDKGWPRLQKDPSTSETFYVEGDLERRDGLTVSIGITYAPLYGHDGLLLNIIANVRDIMHFRRVQEMQNVFISTVSHELRTPVALIKGYASTLNRPDANWNVDTVMQSLSVIEDEADRLTVLIDDLLTASKIQAERTVRLSLTDVQLNQITEHAVERLQTQTANHKLDMSFPDDFPSIQGDARLLRQVVDNLLTNAIKYSPNGGNITVGGRFNDRTVTVFVRDEGAGIPTIDLDRIFERFYRVDGKLTTKTKGTGLGLYLVKAIIEAHGGSIHVKSHLGQGSTFFFTLPRD